MQAGGDAIAHGPVRAGLDGRDQPLGAVGVVAPGEAFGQRDRFKVRNFVSTALDARNATAHLTLDLQDAEALRYLDAIHALLLAVKSDEAAEAKRLYDAQRTSGLGPVPVAAEPGAVAAPPRGTLSLKLDATQPAPENGSGKALRPWIEVALPHPDVLANRFKEAEFAADLFAVDAGHAGEDYAIPENFFRITFLTEGLRRILTSSLERLAGTGGGDPVIGTSFVDVLSLFEADAGTQAIVMIGEIGGADEEQAAAFIREHVSKPVVGFIAEISRALAEADISILSISTYRTDAVLVHEARFDDALTAVKQALATLRFTHLAQH